MSRIYRKQKLHKITAVFLIIGFTVLLWFLLTQWFSPKPWQWLLSYFVSVNLVTWLTFAYDKRIAGREGIVRVPESVMFTLAVAGGLPSALVAMQVLRHKRAKTAFKWKLFLWFVFSYSLLGVGYWLLFTRLPS